MDVDQLHRNKRENSLQALKLILGMALISGFIGFVVAGKYAAIGAVLLALGIAWFGPRLSPQAVLRLFRAQRVDPESAPQLYDIHRTLCDRAGLGDIPPLYYIPTRAPNAFAVGTDQRAAIAVTDGILRAMTTREIAGVLAHEISHIRHNDVWVMSLADSFSRIASTIARFGLMAMLLFMPFAMGQGMLDFLFRMGVVVLAPIMATLLQLALSRSREFNADMGAVELTRDPEGLATGLEKLERMQPQSWFRRVMFPGQRTPEPATLRTHPHTHERIRRLLDLIPQYRDVPNVIQVADRHSHIPVAWQRVRLPARWHPLSGLWH